MMMGIHDRPGSFSDRWIAYCANRGIPYRIVNCLAPDVVRQCEGLDGVLWHWNQDDPSALLVARQVIAALEAKGLTVFPNIATCWHYDDKVAQKYLLEAIDAPLIPTWVFTNKGDALRWIENASFPKVFKLRCGAGSSNVRLVRSPREASALCRKAFGRGFPAMAGYLNDLQTRVRKTKTVRDIRLKIVRAPRSLLHFLAVRRQMQREKGYIYFQEFLPGNAFDSRITIIGNRAFGFMRMNRPNDFRASGSGSIVYDPTKVDKRCVEIAFRVARRIGAQSLAFDFLFTPRQKPEIGEISYCYLPGAIQACSGYWDRSGDWHEGHIWPEEAIMEDMVATVSSRGTFDPQSL